MRYRVTFTANSEGVAIYGELYVFSDSGYLVEAIYVRPDGTSKIKMPSLLDSMMTLQMD